MRAEFELSMAGFADRREQLLAAGRLRDPEARRRFGREAAWWDRFVAALREELELQRQDFEDNGDWWFLPFREVDFIVHLQRQLELAEVYQDWAHGLIRGVYGTA